ncbi:hypothetical protein [Kluyvera intermedia]|uniref:hypothetical protein n=1 Tax=Kluyvera intermedia TaxID=61648 RepID=UPI0039F5C766
MMGIGSKNLCPIQILADVELRFCLSKVRYLHGKYTFVVKHLLQCVAGTDRKKSAGLIDMSRYCKPTRPGNFVNHLNCRAFRTAVALPFGGPIPDRTEQ